MTSAAARPRDVIFAAVLTIMGSVLALAGIFTMQGELRSSGVRHDVETLLGNERFSGVDISVGTVLNAVEIGLMLASAASVAAIVLAVFVIRQHNASRIALTVLGGAAAVLVLLSGLTGIFIAIFVVYTVSLLWRAPVRTWFATEGGSGKGSDRGAVSRPDASTMWSGPPRDDPPASSQPPERPTPPEHSAPERPSDTEPSPAAPTYPGQQTQTPGPYPQPWPPGGPGHPAGGGQGYPGGGQGSPGAPSYPPGQTPGYGYPPGYYGAPPPWADQDRRPVPVVTAHVLIWVGSAFGLIVGAFILFAASSQPVLDVVIEQMRAMNVAVDEAEIGRLLAVTGGLLALWSAAVLVVSIFSWRRANWAAILLTVMGGAYMLLQVVSLVLQGQLPALFTIVWITVVIVLLWLPSSRQWYTGGARASGASGPPGYPSYQPPPQEPPRQRNQPW